MRFLGRGINIRMASAGYASMLMDSNNWFDMVSPTTLSVTPDTTINLTHSITAATQAQLLSILPNNDTVLTTVISMETGLTMLEINAAPVLSVSITTNLKEPSVKDITSSKAIIDSTDTQVESRVETETI